MTLLRIVSPALVALLFVALVGCDSTTDDDSGPLPRDTYPTANIGTAEGSVLANHTFTLPDGGNYTLDEVFFDADNRLLMLVTASGWCGACIEEQPKLQALYDAHADAGLMLVVAVFQDDQFVAADPEDAGLWKSRFDLTFPVVADAPFVLGDYYDASQTPMIMMVDVDTMQILSIETGFNEANVQSIINATL